MHTRTRIAPTFWWLVLLLGTAVSAGVVAAPQSALGPGPQKPLPPVTLSREAVTLEELLPELPNQDVELGVSRAIRWDQLSLYLRQRTGLQIRADLAELFNYSWVRERERRLLQASTRARTYEAELERRWYAPGVQELLEYAALAKQPPQYYTRLRASWKGTPPTRGLTSWVISVFTDPRRHAGVRLLTTLSPQQFQGVVAAEGPGYYLRWKQMTPEQQEIALQIADGTEPGRQWVQRLGLLLRVHLRWRRFFSYTVHLGDAVLVCGDAIDDATGERGLGSPQPRGCPYPLPNPAPTAAAVVGTYRDLERMPFPAAGFRETFPSTWPRIFRQLGERLPFSFYSDASPAEPVGEDAAAYINSSEKASNPAVIPLSKMSVAEALDALCARYGRVWWRKGNALFFRSNTWFLNRKYQPPPTILATIQRQLASQGQLNTQSVTLLSGFSWWQFEGLYRLFREQQPKARQVVVTYNIPWLLPFYAQLTEVQKAQVLGQGLPFARMTPQQQALYQEALFLCRSSLQEITDPPRFRLEQTKLPGTPGKEPSVNCLLFMMFDEPSPTQRTRGGSDVRANLFVPFPLEKPEAGPAERKKPDALLERSQKPSLALGLLGS